MSKWIWKLADNGWADWICPECGWRYNDDIHITLDYKYCPNCGADMMSERTYTLKEVQRIYHEAFRRGAKCLQDIVVNGRPPEKAVEYWYHYESKK